MTSQINNCLIVGPSWIGDMVMSQGLLKLLKYQNPKISIDMLAPAWSESLVCRMPEVRRVLLSPFNHGELKLAARYKLGVSLKKQQYDQAIILPNSFKSALPTYFAKIPIRIGWKGEFRYGLLNDLRILDAQKLPLMLEQFLALGLEKNSDLPNSLKDFYPNLEVSKTNQAKLIEEYKVSISQPILALCPGAEYGQSKRWPAKSYAEVAKAKLKEGWQVWLFGSKKDLPITTEIMQETKSACLNLAGKTTLEDAIDLLAMAKIVLTNDTGLMHVAAALNRRMLVIYGGSSPDFTPPLSENAEIMLNKQACSPCFQRDCKFQHYQCLTSISSAKVLDAIKSLESDA